MAVSHRVFLDRRQPIDDARLVVTRHTDTVFEFPTYTSRDEWLRRAAEIRTHILVCAGLWPMPERTPLNARIFDRTERDGYAVEKVYFESLPGLLVTGNLYRPLGRRGPFPAVLNPHGHWHEGRLVNTDLSSIAGRCIGFARQGYVAFTHDMIGYVDHFQIVHRFFDPRAELWGVTPLGLQLWNNIRALDFLSELPDVNPDRIGCTGESGGGTQTYLVAAVDDRVKVSAPVNMVSAHAQGGCRCENAPGLRVDTYNVEITATTAPRPLLLVSASGDWTANTPRVEYPAIRSIYRLFDAEECVASYQVDAEHNYNHTSREAVFRWFGKWLLGKDPPDPLFQEWPFALEPEERLRVFATTPRPDVPTGDALIEQIGVQRSAQIERILASAPVDLGRFRAVIGPALRHVVGAAYPPADQVTATPIQTDAWNGDHNAVQIERLIIGRKGIADRLPSLLFADGGTARQAVLVVHEAGKAASFDPESGAPGELIRALVSRETAVLAVDLFLQGEFLSPYGQVGRMLNQQHSSCFNLPDAALRVQDILSAVSYLATRFATVDVVGVGDAGLWALLARAIASEAIRRLAADLGGFDPTDADSHLERLPIPNLPRVGGLRTAIAFAAPAPLLIHNTQGRFPVDWSHQVYRAARGEGQITIQPGRLAASGVVDWLRG